MKHLEEADETYIEHMKHAIVPLLFEKGVSSKLDEINSKVKRNAPTA